mgnify:CR=1 FL=1
MAVAIRYGVADSDALRELHAEPLNAVWTHLHMWVEDYKKEKGLPEAWVELEAVHQKWNSSELT